MARGPPPFMVLLGGIALFLWYIFYVASPHYQHEMPQLQTMPRIFQSLNKVTSDTPILPPETQHGAAIASKLGNETLKAELGRAAWKLFHTTMARFPDTPTQDESDALKSYIHLFARLYPCGECAQHFQGILRKYPPQTSSRSTAAAWACHVHNEVNKSKGKELFDCGNIGDFYDCGCEEDEDEAEAKAKNGTKGVDKMKKHVEHVEIMVEETMNGG